MSIGERLRIEREKSGLNQTKFGAIGGVTKKTQMLYESGERMPNAAYLRSVAQIGVDTQFVLIGAKSANLDEVMLSGEFVEETLKERQIDGSHEWMDSSIDKLQELLQAHVYGIKGMVITSQEECDILEGYRQADASGRAALLAVVKAIKQSQP